MPPSSLHDRCVAACRRAAAASSSSVPLPADAAAQQAQQLHDAVYSWIDELPRAACEEAQAQVLTLLAQAAAGVLRSLDATPGSLAAQPAEALRAASMQLDCLGAALFVTGTDGQPSNPQPATLNGWPKRSTWARTDLVPLLAGACSAAADALQPGAAGESSVGVLQLGICLAALWCSVFRASTDRLLINNSPLEACMLPVLRLAGALLRVASTSGGRTAPASAALLAGDSLIIAVSNEYVSCGCSLAAAMSGRLSPMLQQLLDSPDMLLLAQLGVSIEAQRVHAQCRGALAPAVAEAVAGAAIGGGAASTSASRQARAQQAAKRAALQLPPHHVALQAALGFPAGLDVRILLRTWASIPRVTLACLKMLAAHRMRPALDQGAPPAPADASFDMLALGAAGLAPSAVLEPLALSVIELTVALPGDSHLAADCIMLITDLWRSLSKQQRARVLHEVLQLLVPVLLPAALGFDKAAQDKDKARPGMTNGWPAHVPEAFAQLIVLYFINPPAPPPPGLPAAASHLFAGLSLCVDSPLTAAFEASPVACCRALEAALRFDGVHKTLTSTMRKNLLEMLPLALVQLSLTPGSPLLLEAIEGNVLGLAVISRSSRSGNGSNSGSGVRPVPGAECMQGSVLARVLAAPGALQQLAPPLFSLLLSLLKYQCSNSLLDSSAPQRLAAAASKAAATDLLLRLFVDAASQVRAGLAITLAAQAMAMAAGQAGSSGSSSGGSAGRSRGRRAPPAAAAPWAVLVARVAEALGRYGQMLLQVLDAAVEAAPQSPLSLAAAVLGEEGGLGCAVLGLGSTLVVGLECASWLVTGLAPLAADAGSGPGGAALQQLQQEAARLAADMLDFVDEHTPDKDAAGFLGPARDLLRRSTELGAGVCAALPTRYACNNPCCRELQLTSELDMAAQQASTCSACRACRYGCRACQQQHWKAHKPICKQLAKKKKGA